MRWYINLFLAFIVMGASETALVNVYVDLLVFMRIAGTS